MLQKNPELVWEIELPVGATGVVKRLGDFTRRDVGELEQFYRGLREGRDPARALQDAKEHVRGATIGEMSGAHPFFWAPFVLIGSTRARLADRGKSHPDL